MTEFTHGIFSASKTIYENNKGSILRTIIYTIGHFAIAITVLMLIANVSFMIALTDAIVEPLAIIKKGRLCKIQRCGGEWCKVRVQNYKGWIKKKILWGLL